MHPGDTITLSVPDSFPKDGEILAEPNILQAPALFPPPMIKVSDGKFTLTNESKTIVNIKKNCQVARIRNTVPDTKLPIENIYPSIRVTKQKSKAEILNKITIDEAKNLTKEQLNPIIEAITENAEVFQNDLPCYNHYYGKCFANFEFATAT